MDIETLRKLILDRLHDYHLLMNDRFPTQANELIVDISDDVEEWFYQQEETLSRDSWFFSWQIEGDGLGCPYS